jgi:hypothetical protein
MARKRRHHRKAGSKRGYLIRAGRHSKAAAHSTGKKRQGHLMIAKGYRVAAGGSSGGEGFSAFGRTYKLKGKKRRHTKRRMSKKARAAAIRNLKKARRARRR